MALQYIGARYVPKFYEGTDSAWVSGVAYEPLTIVTYAGNSYTSKKPVPASVGSPNDNPEYWVSTGVFNQQVESLIEEIQQTQADLETAISTTVPQMINDSKKKSIICLGDSYNQAWNPDLQTTIKGWGARVIDAYDLTIGTNAWNLAEGGIGFYVTGPGGHNALTLLQTLSLTDAQKLAVTDICAFLGYNDNNSSWTEIHNGALAFIRYCNATYPNAAVRLGMPGWNIASSDSASNIRGRLLTVIDAIYHAHEDAGLKTAAATYLNSCFLLHRASGMCSDGIHPNDGGLNAMCQAICSIVAGGDGAVPHGMITCAVTGDVSGSLSFNGFAGGDSTLALYVAGTIGLATGSDTPVLGDLPDNSLFCRGVYSGGFMIDGFVTRESTENALIPCRILIGVNSSGKVTAKPFVVNAAGTAWADDYTSLYAPCHYVTISRYVL